MAARAKVSAAKGAVMQLKHDLEQMEAQKDLDKKMGGYHTSVGTWVLFALVCLEFYCVLFSHTA
jgi:hypothetical protein